MNRNSNKLFAMLVCLLFVAAALMGCGGGAEATNSPQPQKDGQLDTDQPEADIPETGMEAGVDADAEVPETGEDAEPDAMCNFDVCDPCTIEGQVCGHLTCVQGFWLNSEMQDAAVAHKACYPDPDAGEDADTPDAQDDVIGQDADAGVDASDSSDAAEEAEASLPDATPDAPEDTADAMPDVQPEAGEDAEAGNTQETGTFDAPPPPPEICNNNVDDDGDGLKDCADTVDCTSAPVCQPELCNAMDDNVDGLVDNGPGMVCTFGAVANCSVGGKVGQKTCQAPSCTFGACQTQPEICNNNVDDDGDGLKDCLDPLCAGDASCQCVNAVPLDPCQHIGEYSCGKLWRCACSGTWGDPNNPAGFYCLSPENCSNGTDDDGDGKMDCLDTECYGNPVCSEVCNDGVDNDGNGQTDCSDVFCIHSPLCAADVCNGVDDNQDGLVDNGPGMTCVGTSNNTQPCNNACGAPSTQVCNTTTCTWNECTVASKETSCSDNYDNDCDGLKNCADPDCWGTAACPHNTPTCGTVQLTGQPLVCASWNAQTVPKRVLRGCAFSEADQWVTTADYDQLTVMRRVSGSWVEVPMPVPGKPEGSDIVCVPGTNTVYVVYNQYNVPQGSIVLAKWTGTQLQRLNTPVAEGYNSLAMWAFDQSTVWVFGFKWQGVRDTVIFKWNGSSMVKTPFLQADDRLFYASQFYGTDASNLYAAGWEQVSQTSYAMLAHWDGISWAKVVLPVFQGGFESLHGTSACDVMVGGYYLDASQNQQAVSYQRNGTTWLSQTYPGRNELTSLIKKSSFKYLVTSQSFDGWDWIADIGTSNGDSTLNWFRPTEDFYKPLTSWSIPESSTLMVAGEGATGYIMSSICQ